MEIWKDIGEYEGYYQISTLGLIKSLERKVNSRHGVKTRTVNERIIKTVKNKNGYINVNLRKNGWDKAFTIHRLVANHFIPNHEGKPQVNHKNGIKADNFVENLEWCTASENTKHAISKGLIDVGRITEMAKVNSVNNKRKVNMCSKGGILIKQYNSMSEAEKDNDIPLPNISEVCNGKRITAGGFIWKFSDTKTLIPSQIDSIRRMSSDGISHSTLANMFEIHVGEISKITKTGRSINSRLQGSIDLETSSYSKAPSVRFLGCIK